MTHEFDPNYCIPPGATIIETVVFLGMHLKALAQDLSLSYGDMAKLIRGELLLSAGLAERLERTLGPPASFWVNAERHWREGLAKHLHVVR